MTPLSLACNLGHSFGNKRLDLVAEKRWAQKGNVCAQRARSPANELEGAYYPTKGIQKLGPQGRRMKTADVLDAEVVRVVTK